MHGLEPRPGPGSDAGPVSLGIADLHTHMIPGVDDGASDLESALDALQTLWQDGVTAVVATPHLQASRVEGSRRKLAEEAWRELRAAVSESLPDLTLERGFEISLDVPRLDLQDEALRLGGTRFVLVEFHGFTIPQRSAEVLGSIVAEGYVPVLAHPERYWGYDRPLSIVPEWRAAGVLIQLNGGSLLGENGDGIRARALRFLSSGWVDLIASDNHARPQRCLSLRRVWDYLVARDLEEQARLLLEENPHRILKDESPWVVGSVEDSGGFFSKMIRAFKRGR